jgi:hypothetical protein
VRGENQGVESEGNGEEAEAMAASRFVRRSEKGRMKSRVYLLTWKVKRIDHSMDKGQFQPYTWQGCKISLQFVLEVMELLRACRTFQRTCEPHKAQRGGRAGKLDPQNSGPPTVATY